MSYEAFIFKSYQFDATAKLLTLEYSFDNVIFFEETYVFDFPFMDYDPQQLDRAIQNLFFMAGVSYYKAYLAPTIEVAAGQLDDSLAAFLAKAYQRGLGEFFYINHLDPQTKIGFNSTVEILQPETTPISDGLLVGIGGGKDSLVSIELLSGQPRVATWSLGHAEQLRPLIEKIGLPHFSVERHWDPTLLSHNEQGALNGHVPISAIFACVGTVVSILAGYASAVVSNENSANEPTLIYQGTAINHQYSKSLEFEQDYQALLEHCFGGAARYFSFLRPLSEVHIAELFAELGFRTYQEVFSSCNRAFVHTSHELFWCGECPKCAFVFLALTPFVPRPQLEALWRGKNLLLDPELKPMYQQLLGIAGDKPLECVGEIKESRAAMRLAQGVYPELATYQFDLPDEYDYHALAPHSMPLELFKLLQTAITKTN